MSISHRVASSMLLAAAIAVCGCAGSAALGGTPPGEADPCAGKDLPPCPRACTPAEQPSQECKFDGDHCGNSIGDECTCRESKWQCSVHPPLGPGCNKVCKE